MTDAPAIRPVEERRALIASAVAAGVSRGGRVESQSDYQAVMVYGKKVNHLLHLILTVLTAGLWVFVWIYLVITGGEKRELVQVDDYGNVRTSKV